MIEGHNEITGALLAAQKAVRTALKTSTNTHHGYRYASAEEIIVVGREALLDADLVFSACSAEYRALPGGPAANGGANGHVRVVYELAHVSGQRRELVVEEAVVPTPSTRDGWARPLDKAQFAARTEALGYALRDLLLIPRADAPDAGGRRDGAREERRDERRDERRPTRQAAPPAERQASPAARSQPSVAEPGALVAKITGAKKVVEAVEALEAIRATGIKADVVVAEKAFADRIVEWLGKTARFEHLDALSDAVARARLQGQPAVLVRDALGDTRMRLDKPPGPQAPALSVEDGAPS